MPSLAAAVLLVVPLVWPARFVGADASCFAPPEPPPVALIPPLPPTPADVEPPPAPEAPPAPPASPAPAAERTPIAVALWGDVVLATVPVRDAG